MSHEKPLMAKNTRNAALTHPASLKNAAACARTNTVQYFGIAAVVALLAAVGVKISSNGHNSATPQPWSYRVIEGGVQRVEWSPERKVVAPMLKLKEARILTNTFAAQWPAASSRRWSPTYLATRLPERCDTTAKHSLVDPPITGSLYICRLEGVYSHSSPIFGPLWRPKNQRSLEAIEAANISRVNPFQVSPLQIAPWCFVRAAAAYLCGVRTTGA